MRKPSPAIIIACLALFLSLGGGAYAASRVLITNIHQIGPGVRHELRGKQGPAGPAGATVTTTASAAVAKPLTTTWVTSASQTLTSTTAGVTVFASCPVGEQVIAGGYSGIGDVVTANRPDVDNPNDTQPDSWEVSAHLDPSFVPGKGGPGGTGSTAIVSAYALCQAAA